MIDPRALANLLLDFAEDEGVSLSNLSLNKIAYFVHGIYLAQNGEPLIDAKIEAWQYGPVFREIYHQFKSFSEKPINSRARILNTSTGEYEICNYEISADAREDLRQISRPYLRMRASALVDLSHVHDGPWHQAWFHDGDVNPGMEITNSSIQLHFKQQMRH